MQYSQAFIDVLQFVWGEGFLSPGGPEEVAALLAGETLAGKRVLDIGAGVAGSMPCWSRAITPARWSASTSSRCWSRAHGP